MFYRTLGKSGIQVSALGMGCWAIGGPFWLNGRADGWGQVDDAESIRALHRALDLGINFFDTADMYGCGHSECMVGKALAGRRDQVVIATKFGVVYDEETRQSAGSNAEPEYIRRACEASLRRLNTDWIDLYQLHIRDLDLAKAKVARDTLEDLVTAGKIRYYGWSTDDPERAKFFAEGAHCVAIQQRLNIFQGDSRVLRLCEENNLASINRNPLGMGLLTGKYSVDSKLPADDLRNYHFDFQGRTADDLRKLGMLRTVLTRDGRSLAQAALGWLWARSTVTIPIPGFKTIPQVEENVGAMAFGPLDVGQMKETAEILAGAS